MALSNYTELQASIANWAHRSDLGSIIPDFVALAEARISRDLRLRKQIVTSSLTCTGGVQSVALPSDWLEYENVSVNTNPTRQLVYVSVEQLDSTYSSQVTGIPAVYTIEGDSTLFGPIPDSNYSITAIYYARFPSVITNATNWLLTNHPNIYLHACLVEAYTYIQDMEKVQMFQERYTNGCNQLQAQDDEATHSGSVLRVKVV